jgi:GGDEF domain-containing protein
MRSGGTLVLLCALLENYSSLYEELGSIGCEQAVRETAELAGSCFRRSDFLGRLGEAQFAALAVDAAEPSATVLRQRVESRLAAHNRRRQPPEPVRLASGGSCRAPINLCAESGESGRKCRSSGNRCPPKVARF